MLHIICPQENPDWLPLLEKWYKTVMYADRSALFFHQNALPIVSV